MTGLGSIFNIQRWALCYSARSGLEESLLDWAEPLAEVGPDLGGEDVDGDEEEDHGVLNPRALDGDVPRPQTVRYLSSLLCTGHCTETI